MKDLKSLTLEELKEELKEGGFPAYRAGQLYRWLHVQLAEDPEEMTNLPAKLKQFLSENYTITRLQVADRQISRLDGTQKFLFQLPDGETIESVFMKYKFGNSVCVSSQVGCRMGCRFCASTLDGLRRNLLPGEILEEIYTIHRLTGEKISHVVVMGTGEPLDNYENLLKFLRMLTDENGQNLSMRNVTVSTCGIVPRIYDLAREKLSITLALSLHATTDERRREIMPIANTYTISECMAACRYYFEETGRRVTFEYSLIKGVNDSLRDAKELAALAGSISAHINLIPVNPVRERDYEQPDLSAVQAFRAKLEKHGINVSIRRVLGRDIDGACGQLRHRHIEISG
ncbi:MAG: 23S rRNA (adenine(2503)-C(2))-methyltransferase RlmN [Lachnospiraceae bacterium]|nr:23S rRNA (adenine(2503)-C(2))-methyltransferase RlmN [Bacillota bacterium]MDY2949307.1 23S rRNA (adenine(2503)-C(2))-methyltransferase RlmN [Lachnospiraceae bacterium]CCX63816.1 ribosomal RNA large subunit methyltransferase N [Firmicutes bacterium CAG:791]